MMCMLLRNKYGRPRCERSNRHYSGVGGSGGGWAHACAREDDFAANPKNHGSWRWAHACAREDDFAANPQNHGSWRWAHACARETAPAPAQGAGRARWRWTHACVRETACRPCPRRDGGALEVGLCVRDRNGGCRRCIQYQSVRHYPTRLRRDAPSFYTCVDF